MLKTSKRQGDTIWINHQVNQGGTRKCDTTKYCPNYINKPNQHKIGKKLKGIYQEKIRYQIEKSSLEGYQINDTKGKRYPLTHAKRKIPIKRCQRKRYTLQKEREVPNKPNPL
jgi:hypothetical protein